VWSLFKTKKSIAMEKLVFTTDINASRQKVWDVMFQPETYKEWVGASWPGSFYIGTWKQGETLKFTGPEGGGTVATLEEYKPFERVHAKHVAVLNADGTEDRDSEMAKGWIGTTESYSFTERDGKTHLTVELQTYPDWTSMFNDGWPNALKKLKEICER
jgi:uncharacterized protein YndB with AHSA1/START domain